MSAESMLDIIQSLRLPTNPSNTKREDALNKLLHKRKIKLVQNIEDCIAYIHLNKAIVWSRSSQKWFIGKILKIDGQTKNITVKYKCETQNKRKTLPYNHHSVKIIKHSSSKVRKREIEYNTGQPMLKKRRLDIDRNLEFISDININCQTSEIAFKISKNISYKPKDQILFLGEIDFSLSSWIAVEIGGQNIISTAIYKHFNDITCAKSSVENMKIIKSYNGTVHANIDPTKLTTYDFKFEQSAKKIKLFDKICFGFPSVKEICMTDVFKACKQMLKPNGELHVLVNISVYDGKSQIDSWNINDCDWIKTKQLIMNDVDFKRNFPNYRVRDSKGKQLFLTKCAMYVFQTK